MLHSPRACYDANNLLEIGIAGIPADEDEKFSEGKPSQENEGQNSEVNPGAAQLALRDSIAQGDFSSRNEDAPENGDWQVDPKHFILRHFLLTSTDPNFWTAEVD